MDEEDYNKALEAWSRWADFAKECYEEGINPFTGEKEDEYDPNEELRKIRRRED